ncbi:MAG: hypothetical protein RMI56_04585 [Sulfolobales archaeon]|nr:hypothetical protein [Sulfolobales archaeon]MDW8083061.1 hypothetical protein [Sulfolobales archaeon]
MISLCEDIYSKFYELYRRTANLALRGIDIGELEKLLASALDYLEAGDLSEASRIILD